MTDAYDPAKDGRDSYELALKIKRERGDTHWPSPASLKQDICTKRAKMWSDEDDEFLRSHHGYLSRKDIADELGRTVASVRGRIMRLGISKKQLWSDEEVAALEKLYLEAGSDGVVGLRKFAAEIGRSTSNVCRKARVLGLGTNQKRRTVEKRKLRVRKYATDEEQRAAQSEGMKKWFRENEHPRGMLGKKHSSETREHLSRALKAAQLFVTEEERADRVMRSMKKRAENHGTVAGRAARGSWKAGWREIGGKRNYYRSRWEANYARYLQWLKDNGGIRDWQHEPETFWFEQVKRGVRSYLPDFRVWENDGLSVLHEVKGWMDQRSRTTLKRMAKYHPSEKIIVIDGRQYRAIRLKVMGLVPGWEDSVRDSRA